MLFITFFEDKTLKNYEQFCMKQVNHFFKNTHGSKYYVFFLDLHILHLLGLWVFPGRRRSSKA